MKRVILVLMLLVGPMECEAQNMAIYPTVGEVVREDPALDGLVDPKAKIEVLASGFDWSGGEVWVTKDRGSLLCSDVPANAVFEWTAEKGLATFLKPSGFTGIGRYSDEPGSNGLTLDGQGRLISCEHGDRRVSSMAWGAGK